MGGENRTFAYMSNIIQLNSKGDQVKQSDFAEQRAKLEKTGDKKVYEYFFSEEDSMKSSSSGYCRVAFNMMLTQLRSGDKVVICDWHCFVDPNHLDASLMNVLDKIRQIHLTGAHVVFLEGNFDTSCPASRHALIGCMSTEQYIYDIDKLKSVSVSSNSNNCCASPASK